MIFCRKSQRELLAILEQECVDRERDRAEIEKCRAEIRAYRERLANGDQWAAAAQMRALNAERKVERLERELRERTSW